MNDIYKGINDRRAAGKAGLNPIEQSAGALPPAPVGIANAAVPTAQGQQMAITPEIAQQFIMKAGGDRAKGRELARAAGYQI